MLLNQVILVIVVPLACVFTWLPWHQTDLKLNTRASMATYHAYLLVQHGHPQNVDRFGKILAIQLIKHHWPRLVCALLLLPTISVWVYFLMSFPLDGHVLVAITLSCTKRVVPYQRVDWIEDSFVWGFVCKLMWLPLNEWINGTSGRLGLKCTERVGRKPYP